MKNFRTFLVLLSFGISLISNSAYAANLSAFTPEGPNPSYAKWSKQWKIPEDYSPTAYHTLITATETMLLEEKSKDENDQNKGKIKLLNYAIELLTKKHNRYASNTDLMTYYNQGRRIIYTIVGEEYDQRAIAAGRRNLGADSPHERIQSLLRFLKRKTLLKVALQDPTTPIGMEQALKEAKNLQGKQESLAVQALSTLTPEELSNLDLREDHTVFYSQKYLDEHPGLDLWARNEEWVNESITQILKEKYGLNDVKYNLLESQRVLFFDDVKLTGTSPKINLRDAFNIKWKMKWMDEIHAATIANRLYLKLGAKFVDLEYATKFAEDGTVVILNDPNKIPDPKAICNPITADDLAKCVYSTRRGVNKSNIRSFIHESGVITKENIGKILSHLHPNALENYRPQKLLGRQYVTFKESLLEINPPHIEDIGPIAESNAFATEDRGLRGLLLFNSWINNNDVRENNGKTYLLNNFPDESGNAIQGATFVEERHDLGKSLAGVFSAANPNRLQTGNGYLRIDDNREHLHFNYFILHLPGAWLHTTYSDLLWMGKRIIKITRSDLQAILEHTYWPDFYKEAMLYKLLKRRNLMAKYLGIEHLIPIEERDIPAPSLEVPLYNKELRKAAALYYKIPIELLEETYQNSKLPIGHDRYSDKVLIDGRVNDSTRSLLIRVLRQYRHPAGLDRRRSRINFVNKINPQTHYLGIPWDII
ncbi:MAG: hypothetical protein HQK52_07590 [Oligoflexia bacterium]|nr:hypothetical protein [Oligoflexia bacterium]